MLTSGLTVAYNLISVQWLTRSRLLTKERLLWDQNAPVSASLKSTLVKQYCCFVNGGHFSFFYICELMMILAL